MSGPEVRRISRPSRRKYSKLLLTPSSKSTAQAKCDPSAHDGPRPGTLRKWRRTLSTCGSRSIGRCASAPPAYLISAVRGSPSTLAAPHSTARPPTTARAQAATPNPPSSACTPTAKAGPSLTSPRGRRLRAMSARRPRTLPTSSLFRTQLRKRLTSGRSSARS